MKPSRRHRLLAAVLVLASVLVAQLSRSQNPVDLPLTFLALGDWGRGGAFHQQDLADQMAAYALKTPIRFVVSTGDNFLEYGVKSASDPLWKRSFESVYSAQSLMVPWYVVPGNHDYRGSVEAEIQYGKTSPRWRMPDRYYTVSEPIGHTSTLQLFFLDTSPFVGSYRSPVSITKVAGQDPKVQLAWLDKELSASTAAWKIVVGHHPVYSAGEHGNTAELIRDVEPLLEKYHVQAYLNGHDHDLQHLRDGPVNYFTSGAGSKTNKGGHDLRTLFSRGNTSGFMAFSLTPERMTVTVVDLNGTVLYSTSVAR
jgi:tartrate-resistant acid phosphatase type 5